MKIGNLSEPLIGPFDGKPLILEARNETGADGVTRLVEIPMTLLNAVGAVVMFQGKSQGQPNAPELTSDDKTRIFGLNMELVKMQREGGNELELSAEDVVFIRKMGEHCLHPVVFGYLDAEMSVAESMGSSSTTPDNVEQLKAPEGIPTT